MMRIDSSLPIAPPRLLDSKSLPLQPDKTLIASVDVTGGPLIIGAGARNTAAGLNWMVLGVDALGAGSAALKALQGQKLTPDDKVIVNGYFEANARNSGPMGKLLQALFGTGNLGMEAGCNVQVTLSGDTDGGLRISKVTAFPLGIMPEKGALSPDAYRRFSGLASLHVWEFAEQGGVRYSVQPASKEGSFTQLKSGASGKGAIDLGKVGNAIGIDGLAYGWVEFPGGAATVPGMIKNHIPARLPGSPASGSTLVHKISDSAIAGGVVRDMISALSDKKQLDSSGRPEETTLRGWVRMIVKPGASASPVGMLIEANGSITARQDGKDEIRFLLSNSNKPFFTTSASKLRAFGDGVMNAVKSATRSLLGMDEVERMVSTGAYRPAIALRRMFNFDPRHTNVVRDASLINQATQSAVAGGLAAPKALGEQWVAVLEGRFNAGLSGRDLQAGKLLAATVLGRPQDVTRLTQQLFPGAGLEGGMRPLGLPGSASNDSRSALQPQNMPVGQVIAGHRVFDVRLVHRDIGNEVKRTGTGLQGSLMQGRTQGGTPVFWLQGQRTNYILRNPDGKLVTNLQQAEQRAKAYIRHELASDLRPLDLRHVSPRVGAQATVGNTRSIDGVAIAGGVVSLGRVGGPVGNNNELARQGLLMWGRTPSGEARFWLQGKSNNYMLRDADGQFVADSVSATARAKDYIRHSLASDLRPLSLGALRADNGQVAVRQPLRLIDGMTIVGGVSSVTWVGAKVWQSIEGRQGLLQWGRTLGGDVVFWLRGLNEDRVLRDDRGALIANQAEAIERAKQLIQFKGMQNLHPLPLR